MNCDETFNAGIHYVTDAYKRVCKFNEELHADLEECRAENDKLRELCKEWYRYARELFDEFIGEPELDEDFMTLEDRLRKLGVEPY